MKSRNSSSICVLVQVERRRNAGWGNEVARGGEGKKKAFDDTTSYR